MVIEQRSLTFSKCSRPEKWIFFPNLRYVEIIENNTRTKVKSCLLNSKACNILQRWIKFTRLGEYPSVILIPLLCQAVTLADFQNKPISEKWSLQIWSSVSHRDFSSRRGKIHLADCNHYCTRWWKKWSFPEGDASYSRTSQHLELCWEVVVT